MAEYIEREALLTDICDDMCGLKYTGVCENCRVVALIADAHAADVAPVVHGRWEYIPQTLNTLSSLRCPFCGWWSLDPSIDGAYNYCPNCGAKMDGGDSDAAD